MSNPIIQVEGISKSYKISHELKASVGNVSIRDGINNIVRKPIELITGHRMRQEKFWALKDINFEVEQGEVLGIIGKNGSGKSTLLKIMSRITEPTKGEIRMHGRVASLLEVGTGFHPELTGRENIYFNGSILGMRKKEIESKFDEIVAFSEVEKFLDTPVKFYSSGMYVRLAFAVAAHLDPDILIIDEVLAVGDAAFQKKCLGKMQDAAGEGRTVLFVSHNMNAVRQLCSKAILLENGQMKSMGEIGKVAQEYLKIGKSSKNGNYSILENLLFSTAALSNKGVATASYNYGDELKLTVKTLDKSKESFGMEIRLKNSNGDYLAYGSSFIDNERLFQSGDTIVVTIPQLNLAQDSYTIDLIARVPKEKHVANWWDTITFDLIESRPGRQKINLDASEEIGNVILPEIKFERC